MKNIEYRLISSLTPHPINDSIYGDCADNDLIESVRLLGITTPLSITNDGTVISGHRRLDAARKIGLESVPVNVSSLTNDLEIEEALIHSNKQRVKTEDSIAYEYKRLKAIEAEKAKLRKIESAKNQKRDDYGVFIEPKLAKLPTTAKNKSAGDIAAEQLGVSRRSVEKRVKVLDAEKKLRTAGDVESANTLRESLDKSTNAGYEKWQALADKTQTDNNPIPIKTTHKSKFNQPSDSIEWAKWSWNPVTGCLHGCKYCYARDIALRFQNGFPKGFEPDFREERLNAPECTKIPSAMIGKAGSQNVFVCSMADLFGKWVPQEWIDKVFQSCNNNPQWNYLFLTKNPQRYLTLDFPKTAWIGATGDTQKRMNRALSTFNELSQNGKKTPVTFISCEPLNESIVMNEQHLKSLDWLIIGGQSKSTNEPAKQPEIDWVISLMKQAIKHNVKLYFKPNLTIFNRKEYPASLAIKKSA